MARQNSQNTSSRSLDEAIAWHVRIGDAGADEEIWAGFTAWLEADPANRIAFDRVEDIDSELNKDILGEFSGPDEHAPNPLLLRRPGWRVAAGIAAGGLAASLVLAFVFLNRAPQTVEYATRVGESRTVILADGTRIEINTATRLRVDQAGGRRVTLETGEALFHVAKDNSHPFIVTVGDRDIRDIGTVFDVLRNGTIITVVVAEGRVGVSAQGAALAREVALQSGDKLVHSEVTGATSVEKVDPEQALAWRRGYLVYRNAPLSAVASDLNRYFPVPIALDEGAAAQHFTGVLRIDNQNAMLNRISQFLPVMVDRGKDGRIVLRASAARP